MMISGLEKQAPEDRQAMRMMDAMTQYGVEPRAVESEDEQRATGQPRVIAKR